MYLVNKLERTTLPPPFPLMSTTRFGIFFFFISLKDFLKKLRSLLPFVKVFTSIKAVCIAVSIRKLRLDSSSNLFLSFFESDGGCRVTARGVSAFGLYKLNIAV